MLLLVISTPEDIIMTKEDCCLGCLEKKLNLTIYKKHSIENREYKQLRTMGIRGVTTQCSNLCFP